MRAGLAFSFLSRLMETVLKKERFGIMPLVQVILLLIIVGVVLFLINQYIPMASSIKSILNAVVVIAVIIWLLNVFGLLSSNPRLHIG